MRRRWGVASTIATTKLRRGTGAANNFFGLCMLRLPGWDGARRPGTERYRVQLEGQQKGGRHPCVFPAVSSAVLFLIDGPDFDCVSVTVWPARD